MESFGLRWCQRIQLLIIDLASSQQQNRPPGPKGGTGRYQRWTDTRAHNLKGKGEQLRIVHLDYNELCLLRAAASYRHPSPGLGSDDAPGSFSPSSPSYPSFSTITLSPTLVQSSTVAIHIPICNTSSSIIDSGNAANSSLVY